MNIPAVVSCIPGNALHGGAEANVRVQVEMQGIRFEVLGHLGASEEGRIIYETTMLIWANGSLSLLVIGMQITPTFGDWKVAKPRLRSRYEPLYCSRNTALLKYLRRTC